MYKLNKYVITKEEELVRLKKVVKKFPKTKIYLQKEGKFYLYSEEVNSIATDVKFSVSCCGNCSAYPFIISDGLEIYSDPRNIHIGEENYYGFGIIPKKSWDTNLKKIYSISDTAIHEIQKFLDTCPPIAFDDTVEEENE